MTIVLIIPSKIAGGVIGLITGYFIVFILLVIFLIPFESISLISDSTLANIILDKTPIVSKSSAKYKEAIKETYQLGDDVVKNYKYFRYYLYRHSVGEKVTITYNREGKEKTVEVTLKS